MEERIVTYDTNFQIEELIDSLLEEGFLFVRHNVNKKQLFFKKTIIQKTHCGEV